MFDPNLTLDRFLKGESNRLARAALADLAADRPAWEVRGLLLAAAGPWGKTHLLTALARRLDEDGRRPYTFLAAGSAEDWPLPDGWPNRGLVIVDDAHLLAERPETQRRLIQAFDSAPPHRPSLVFSASGPPGRLAGLLEPLRSRLGGGLILSLNAPEYELLLALAVRRAGELALDCQPDILSALVRQARGDPRRLLGLVETLNFIVRRGGLSPAEALTRLGPAEAAPDGTPDRALGLGDILAGVAAAFGLKVSDLTGHSRLRQAAWPRRVAMLLAREMTRLTTTEIGAAFGGRDHSTVIHALKKIHQELRLPAQAKLVENIKRSLLWSGPAPAGGGASPPLPPRRKDKIDALG